MSAGSTTAPWYETVTDASLRQGDIFRGLNVVWGHPELRDTTGSPGEEPVRAVDGNFIIASASCDVAQPGYPYVLLHRITEATAEALRVQSDEERLKKLEVLRQGLVPSQFLLAPSMLVNPGFPLSFVEHKIHALVPVGYLKGQAGSDRLRLRHPHRERFGVWVGSCFARVGPEDSENLPKFATIHPKHVLDYAGD